MKEKAATSCFSLQSESPFLGGLHSSTEVTMASPVPWGGRKVGLEKGQKLRRSTPRIYDQEVVLGNSASISPRSLRAFTLRKERLPL